MILKLLSTLRVYTVEFYANAGSFGMSSSRVATYWMHTIRALFLIFHHKLIGNDSLKLKHSLAKSIAETSVQDKLPITNSQLLGLGMPSSRHGAPWES